MYVDRKRRRWPYIVVFTVVIIAAVFLLRQTAQSSSQALAEESAVALRAAIQRSALQCYVVEGAYPSSLDYLEENYALQINKEDYYVVYDVFAPNLPPYVQVTVKP